MALRNFSSPFRILATANFSFFFILICLHFADLKRIDDNGITVPNRYQPDDPLFPFPLIDWDGGSPSHHHSQHGQGHVTGYYQSQDQSGPFPPGRVIAIKNRPLRLPCPIKISPSVRVLELWWLKDGVQFNYHHQQQQSLNPTSQNQSGGGHPEQSRIKLIGSDLHFDKIVHKVSGTNSGNMNHPTTTSTSSSTATAVTRHRNYSDEGNYRCVVKTANGVIRSSIINVAVAALDVQEATSNVSKKEGEWVILQCSIKSVPRAKVGWSFDNVTLSHESDSRYKLLSSGTLLISNLQVTDSGLYRCMARNEVMKKERRSEIHLTVTSLDKSSTLPEPMAPYFLETFEDNSHVFLDEEEDFAVDCIAYGVPLPGITWVFTYLFENETTSSPISSILSDGRTGHDVIYLTPHNSTITANYTCLVNNGIGQPLTRTIQVSRFPLILKSMESQQFPPAKTVRFECRVPSPFYLLWYKDGQLLETGKGRVKTRGNELVISNTIRNDSGFYQCEVLAGKNSVYSVGTARLLVESTMAQPNAPVEIECKAESSRMISVSWKVGSNSGSVKAFTIHYMAVGEEERQQVTKNTTFLIETLKPHTNYSIYVRSYSGHSASAQSQRVFCITLEDVPINVPRPLLFDLNRNRKVARVRWRPLSNAEARGRIILYKIQWRPIEGSFINVRFLVGRADEFLITDLAPNQLYEMRVIPATTAGYPVDKDQIPWQAIPTWRGIPDFTPPSVHSNSDTDSEVETVPHQETGSNSTNMNSNEYDMFSRPPSVHLTVVNSTAILVHWIEPSRPRTNVTPKGFRIFYANYLPRIDDVIYYEPYILEYDIREYLFTEFAPATSYEISVQTFGEGWESDIGTKSIRTFSNTPPGNGLQMEDLDDLPAISGLQALPLSESSIKLTWDPPKNGTSEPINFYTIKYNRVDSVDFHYIRSTRESIEIKDLTPFTAYEFMVRYHNGRRLRCSGDRCGFTNQTNVTQSKEGPFSQKVESRTLSGRPGIPLSLDWKVTGNRTIHLSWLAPLEPNGLIQQYWVEYKNKTDQEFQTQSIAYFSPGSNHSTIDTPAGPTLDWCFATTNTTSISLQNLTPNDWYVVRVRAETRAGIGQATVPMMIRIFLNAKPTGPPHHHEPVNHEMQDGPPIHFIPTNKQHLGFIIGSSIGVSCIIICITIIVCRNRCFPIFSRIPSRTNVHLGNGVEMKALQSLTAGENHLDTKGGHPVSGIIPGGPNHDGITVSDPLLMRIVRNPISEQRHDLDVEIRGNNCIR